MNAELCGEHNTSDEGEESSRSIQGHQNNRNHEAGYECSDKAKEKYEPRVNSDKDCIIDRSWVSSESARNYMTDKASNDDSEEELETPHCDMSDLHVVGGVGFWRLKRRKVVEKVCGVEEVVKCKFGREAW